MAYLYIVFLFERNGIKIDKACFLLSQHRIMAALILIDCITSRVIKTDS